MWPDVYWRSERYVAMEVDTPGQMHLAFDNRDGTSLGLVDATVFAVGADTRYIVVKQHPATDGFGHFDRSVTNYFYIERTDSSDFRERQRRVIGPLSEQDFRGRAAALKLPSFQKTFRDLQ
jgi:hypothetical protein